MTAGEFCLFGSKEIFAIEARLLPASKGNNFDCDNGYGECRLYLKNICLTRHTTKAETRDEIRWYLKPFVEWLDAVWFPLFHEQRLPQTVGTHENTILSFEQGERLLLDDASVDGSARRREMQEWRKRHSLWTAAAGGVLPNVWFRRQSDLMEISFDPGTTVGADNGFEFHFNRGSRLLDVGEVARAFYGFLDWGTKTIPNISQKLPQSNASNGKIARRWMLGDDLADLLDRITTADDSQAFYEGILYPLDAEVAMFGTLTPRTSELDAKTLLSELRASKSKSDESFELSKLLIENEPATKEYAWEQGYQLAIQTLEELNFTDTRPIRIGDLLSYLHISIRGINISDKSLRGVAIAGTGFTPTILINESASWNKTTPGRRFTIAHEFAHILVDRGRARRVTHSSTPWAPEAIERRANAFAAMFLMPYRVVDRAIQRLGPVSDLASLKRLSKRLDCGRLAVLEHLKNIDRLDEVTYFDLKAQMALLF